MLLATGNKLQGHKLQWHTDNQNVVRIIDRGSTKTDLQAVAKEVAHLCATLCISLNPVWVPRESNQLADYISKLTDADDWGILPSIFQWINSTCYSIKCLRFNSFLESRL